MTWEETILFARAQNEYKDLIQKCYLTEDLVWNVEHYSSSEEFKEILKLIKLYAPNAKNLIEFGAGNGIASISLAKAGYTVLSTEPDTSESVGSGAIKKLISYFELKNITISESYAEEITESDNKFDIVFARQCMHHANNLNAFTKNAYRILKPGGLFFTIRDHIIDSENNKKQFLAAHPFHKYYGGENAFTQIEYEQAIINAGFKIKQTLKYFENILNYFPEIAPLEKAKAQRANFIKNKFPALSNFKITNILLHKLFTFKYGAVNNDKNVLGRMYSFIAIK